MNEIAADCGPLARQETSVHIYLCLRRAAATHCMSFLDYCVSDSISPSIILPAAICWTAQLGSEGMCRHMSPSAHGSMETCWLLIDESEQMEVNNQICSVIFLKSLQVVKCSSFIFWRQKNKTNVAKRHQRSQENIGYIYCFFCPNWTQLNYDYSFLKFVFLLCANKSF